MNHSIPGLPVHHQLPEFTQTHAHQVGDAIQPSHPLSSLSPPALVLDLLGNTRSDLAFSLEQVTLSLWSGSFGCLYLSVQFSSVTQSCPTLCDSMSRSTPGLPVHHQLPEFTQTHIHRVGDAIQPSHPLSSPTPLAPNSSQHQSLFQ